MKTKTFQTTKDFEKYLEKDKNSLLYYYKFKKKPQVIAIELENDES